MKSIVKKICLVAILLVIAGVIIFVAMNASQGKREIKVNTNSTTVEKVSQSKDESNVAKDNSDNNKVVETKPATETQLSDGIEYSVTDEEIKPEIVFKDSFFDTQISEINTNFPSYEGCTVEIEGLYFENENYTFVGRYSTSNLCAYCPTGYSYFEYEWHGDKKPELVDSESWIKIVGTLKEGNDGVDYYYIDVARLEVMNEKGQETVSN